MADALNPAGTVAAPLAPPPPPPAYTYDPKAQMSQSPVPGAGYWRAPGAAGAAYNTDMGGYFKDKPALDAFGSSFGNLMPSNTQEIVNQKANEKAQQVLRHTPLVPRADARNIPLVPGFAEPFVQQGIDALTDKGNAIADKYVKPVLGTSTGGVSPAVQIAAGLDPSKNPALGFKPPTAEEIAADPTGMNRLMGHVASGNFSKSLSDNPAYGQIFADRIGSSLQQAYGGKSADLAAVNYATDATMNFLRSQEGQVFAQGLQGGFSALPPEQKAQLFGSEKFVNFVDAHLDAAGSAGAPEGAGAVPGFDAVFKGRMSQADKAAMMKSYLATKSTAVSGLKDQIKSLQHNDPRAAQMQAVVDREQARLATMASKESGIQVDPKTVGVLLNQKGANHDLFLGIASETAAGKDTFSAVWDAIKDNPFEKIKSMLFDPDARSMMWDYAKGWAGANPGKATLVGGIALIGVLSMAAMAFNMVGGLFGGDEEEGGDEE